MKQNIVKQESLQRQVYVPVSVKVIDVTPRGIVCISPGESTVSNPFGGNEEEW